LQFEQKACHSTNWSQVNNKKDVVADPGFYKDQLLLSNLRNALHHGERAANK